MATPDINKLLASIYYTPESKGSFGGVDRLYKEVKKRWPDISRTTVKGWLDGQETYGVHYPFIGKVPRSRTVVGGIDYMWDVDLMDMSRLSRYNGNVKFILLVIDVFSRYVWTFPMKSKSGFETANLLKRLITSANRKPKYIRSDKGKEFLNKHVQVYLKMLNVVHIVTQSEMKAALAERAIKTIKGRLFKYMFHKQTKKYINVLEAFTKSYNASYHRVLKMAPIQVNHTNEKDVWRSMYMSDVNPLVRKFSNLKGFVLSEGDYVRVSFLRGSFAREYRQKWSPEIFQVYQRRSRDGLYVYWIRDLGGEKILGSFYREELLRVQYSPDDVYKIEKIIKKKKDSKGKLWFYVKWLNWGTKHNSWVREADVVDL